ncbi:hypothetical protein M9H77_30234 [Catharanthus roseus]|uniref:Uncharacterized protein n=1 Tax=Catharanthus roseus TaxID=4058 RepID=A0ACB9ZXZ6_CATRO|nr:hypothetical protein M9H77_30234 [Catharanthus roseus]
MKNKDKVKQRKNLWNLQWVKYLQKQISYHKLKRIQSQFLNFLTTTCGTKRNHGMKAKEEGMGKELSNGFEDTSLSLSLNPFLYYHEFSFKELKLFLELYASYVTFVGNVLFLSLMLESVGKSKVK